MAGSYKHATTDAGKLRDNKSFVGMIENLGDAYEMTKEMYGMIWVLARRATPDDPASAVEEARQNYRDGLSGPSVS